MRKNIRTNIRDEKTSAKTYPAGGEHQKKIIISDHRGFGDIRHRKEPYSMLYSLGYACLIGESHLQQYKEAPK